MGRLSAAHAAGHPRRVRPWRLVALVALAALVLALLGPSAALAHPPGTTQRVSVSSTGTAGDDFSVLAAVSADGRFVAFWSAASNLVPGDTNGTTDVFVHDRQGGTTERVSVDSKERQSVGGDRDGVVDTNFGRPAISGDGRYVVFATSATNLVSGDKNQAVDVFLRDRAAGTTERVSVVGRKTEANGESSDPAISADGRVVAFASLAENLATGDTNFASDVFVRDRQTGTTEGVSIVTPSPEFGNFSGSPVISADGRYVAFDSRENLVPEDTGGSFDVFVRDRATGVLERVSVDSAGAQGDDWSLAPSINADGRYVAFTSFAENLVADDSNFDADIFVHDRQTHTTVRASVTSDGTQTGFELGSLNASLSPDGQVVAFESEGALVAEDSEFPVDVFVHDEQPQPTSAPSPTSHLALIRSRLTTRLSSLDREVTMRRRVLFLVATLGMVGMLAVGAPAYGEGRPFATTLTGAAEVPGPGDPDASGTAFLTLNQGQGEVCFELSWAGIDGTVTAAHIHVGPAGVAGDVVVPLFTDVALSGTDSASGCVSGVSRELIKAIRQDPAGYYVNVHSSVFPAGAVRGQLGT